MTSLQVFSYLQRLLVEENFKAGSLDVRVRGGMTHPIELVLRVRALFEHHAALVEERLVALERGTRKSHFSRVAGALKQP